MTGVPLNGEYLTVPQVAAKIGCSVVYVRQLIEQERIVGAQRVGRDWLIPTPVRVLTTAFGG